MRPYMPSRPSGTYEPPTSCAPIPKNAWEPTLKLAPGVSGFAFRAGPYIFIPLIVAEHKGDGCVGRFLDALSPNCIIAEVISDRLTGMLLRRGFVRLGSFWCRS